VRAKSFADSKAFGVKRLRTYKFNVILKGQSHKMFKALFKYGLIGLGQERNR
jgi:hypothetical protein